MIERLMDGIRERLHERELAVSEPEDGGFDAGALHAGAPPGSVLDLLKTALPLPR